MSVLAKLKSSDPNIFATWCMHIFDISNLDYFIYKY